MQKPPPKPRLPRPPLGQPPRRPSPPPPSPRTPAIPAAPPVARFSASDFPDSTFQRLPVTDSVPLHDPQRPPSSVPDPFPATESPTSERNPNVSLMAQWVAAFDDLDQFDRESLVKFAYELLSNRYKRQHR